MQLWPAMECYLYTHTDAQEYTRSHQLQPSPAGTCNTQPRRAWKTLENKGLNKSWHAWLPKDCDSLCTPSSEETHTGDTQAHTLHHVDAMLVNSNRKIKTTVSTKNLSIPSFFASGSECIKQHTELFQVTDNRATPQCSASACISTIKTHQSGTHTNACAYTHEYTVHSESTFHLCNSSESTVTRKTNMAPCSNMHTHIETCVVMQHAHAADGSSLYIDLAQDYIVKELFRKLDRINPLKMFLLRLSKITVRAENDICFSLLINLPITLLINQYLSQEMPITISLNHNWHGKIAVKLVQNSGVFSLLSQTMKKTSMASHLKSWKMQTFALLLLKND